MADNFPCSSCGAWLHYTPGEHRLTCPYCSTEQAVAIPAEEVREQDFHAWLTAGGEGRVSRAEVRVLPCGQCGAKTTTEEHVSATSCSFCGHAIVAAPETLRQIPPTGMLPFAVDREDARRNLRAWLGRLWFAPSGLAKRARSDDPLDGIYAPYWTYDTRTVTDYRGQRGDHYWVTESYTVMVNGKAQMRTRQVQKTRWRPASGRVRNTFDDVLVLASDSLPRDVSRKLEPWDLQSVVPFTPSFLAGFRAETYRTGLAEGFEIAKDRMDPAIRARVRQDIGGDVQRISDMHVSYREVSFKHLLLPIWLSSYRYKNRTFRFLVNARTGEVTGERPYSLWKIAFAILLGLALIGTIVFLTQQR